MYLIKDGETRSYGSKNRYGDYTAEIVYEDIEDNPRLNLRVGDIVRFTEYSKIKYKKNQFAVILNRFKKIKTCFHGRYVDYGIEFMMITGSKKGEIKKQFLMSGSPTKYI